jgi:hypothetical protein
MARYDAVHRTVLVVDIAESSHPFRRDGDRIVMRNAMYQALTAAFRLAEAPPLKAALAASRDACAFIVSDWFYSDVVYHHQDARPDNYRPITCEVKGTQLSAWLRVPRSPLALVETPWAGAANPGIAHATR